MKINVCYYFFFFILFSIKAAFSDILLENLPKTALYNIQQYLFDAKKMESFNALRLSSSCFSKTVPIDMFLKKTWNEEIFLKRQKKANDARALFSLGEDYYCRTQRNENVICGNYDTFGQAKEFFSLGPVRFLKIVDGHTCAIKKTDEYLYCWVGKNYQHAIDVPKVLGPITTVGFNENDICAVQRSTNDLLCWGKNYEEISNITDIWDRNSTVNFIMQKNYNYLFEKRRFEGFDESGILVWNSRYFGNDSHLTSSSADFFNLSSVSTTNSIYFCGIKEEGALPICYMDTDIPVSSDAASLTIPSSLGAVLKIEPGMGYFCAVKKENGQVQCWDDGIDFHHEKPFPHDLGSVIDLKIFWHTACAIAAKDHKMVCWGENEYGQADVPVDLGVVTSMDIHKKYACAVKRNGVLECWGSKSLIPSKN